jgi:hypothetical protein
MLLFRKRDFRRDARDCVSSLHPALKVLGQENIPQHGPCVVTVNHYHREGFSAEWLALSIASCVPVQMHWVMTGESMYVGKWYQAMGAPVSRILLNRIATVYDFTTMPPMPPRERDVEQRAASIRRVLEVVRRTANPVIGLAPEGYDSPAGTLTKPASGVGRFGLLLSKAGLRFYPVGAYEEDGCFQICFGEPYGLDVEKHVPPDEKDAQASQIIMEHIARLVPLHLRGGYA